MDTQHEATHQVYMFGLKAITGKLTPAYRQQWEVATRHIPSEQMQRALDELGIRIGANSITVPMAGYAHTINRERVATGGYNGHLEDYKVSRRW